MTHYMFVSDGKRPWHFEEWHHFHRRLFRVSHTWSRRNWRATRRHIEAHTKKGWHDKHRHLRRQGLVLTDMGWLRKETAERLSERYVILRKDTP